MLRGGMRVVTGAGLVAGLCAGACAGCGTESEKGGVRAAVNAFYRDVRDGKGNAACDRLVPQAASSLEAGDARCEKEILTLGLEGGPLGRVEVWSDAARVRAGDETVFLIRWGGGWRITAAGCQARQDAPYHCDIST